MVLINFVLTENYFHYRVNEALTERANQFGLILDDISITHLTFGREFTHAVELKQVAQQEAEKAKFRGEKAEQIKFEYNNNTFLFRGKGIIYINKYALGYNPCSQLTEPGVPGMPHTWLTLMKRFTNLKVNCTGE